MIWLYGIFIFTGVTALTYEVAWFRVLSILFGGTTEALAMMLSAFLGGTSLGSFLAARFGDRSRLPLVWVSLCELFLGAYNLLFPWLVVLWEHAALTVPSSGTVAVAFRLLAAFSLLGPPTVAIGATLPMAGRWLVERIGRPSPSIGNLYAANTGGAAVGAVLCGFVLLPRLGLYRTLLAAAFTNFFAAACLGLAAWKCRRKPTPQFLLSPPSPEVYGAAPVAIAVFALSGFVALGYEVLWGRFLDTVFANTVFGVSAMLGVFLSGNALGAILGGRWASRLRFPTLWLGGVQIALGIWIFALIVPMARIIRVQSNGSEFLPASATLSTRFCVTAALLLIPATLLGMVFPLVTRTLEGARGGWAARLGLVLGANAGAAVAGSLTAGYLGLPALGLRNALITGAFLNIGAGIVLWQSNGRTPPALRRAAWAIGLGALVVLPFLPGDLRHWRRGWREEQLVAYKTGADVDVAVIRDRNGLLQIKINNHYVLGGEAGVLIERKEGHLPYLLVPGPVRRVLHIGVGSGNTTGALASYPDVQVDGVEIVQGVLDMLPHFSETNRDLARQPNVRLIRADGMHFVRRPGEPYDLIVSDLFLPWRTGEAWFYTAEHFQRARARLSHHGLFCQWIPLYQIDPASLRSIAAAFLRAFPYGQAWLADLETFTPLLGLIGSRSPFAVNPQRVAERAAMLKEEARRGLPNDPAEILDRFLSGPEQLEAFVGGAVPNTLDRPIVEFTTQRLVGMEHQLGALCLEALLPHRTSPSTVLAPGSIHPDPRSDQRHRAMAHCLAAHIASLKNAWRDMAGQAVAALELRPFHRLAESQVTWAVKQLSETQAGLQAARLFVESWVEANPGSPDAIWSLYQVHQLAGNPEAVFLPGRCARRYARELGLLVDQRLGAQGPLPQHRLLKGIALQRLGERDARSEVKAALEADPGLVGFLAEPEVLAPVFEPAVSQALQTLVQQGQLGEDAVLPARVLRERHPQDSAVTLYLAAALANSKRLEAAIAVIRELLLRVPEKRHALLNCFTLLAGLVTQGRDAEAHTVLRALLEWKTTRTLVLLESEYILKSLYEQKHFRAMRSLGQGLIEFNSNQPQIRYWVGLGYAREGEVEVAAEHFQKAVELDPGLANAWMNLAWARLQLGDAERAWAALQKGREKGAPREAVDYLASQIPPTTRKGH